MFHMPVSHCYPLAESVSFVTEDAAFKAIPRSHQLRVDMESLLLPPGSLVCIAGAYLKSEDVSRSASDFS
jgi:hypothetical protein